MMKLVTALLLVFNVVLYLWASGHYLGAEPTAAVVQPDINYKGMLLLRERPLPVRYGAGEMLCYRMGPLEGAMRAAAARWLEGLHLPRQEVRGEHRKVRIVRVYVGPYTSPAAAATMQDKLAHKGVTHSTLQEPGEAIRISLGHFTQQALATEFIAHLRVRDIHPQTAVDYHTMGPLYWVETLVEAAQQERLLAFQRPAEWGTLAPVECAGTLRLAQVP